ncbi:MAG: hypothetical protein A3F43_00070 [Gammaproteobacteria bacterium RIFCSPHIGHO2_12_FULL_42_10]|nr:MAG: hypothetical protein A3F43_00070 [Gammaproteobacteria bacterium RIFCSPHIGHO2_12_FULL_42_10]
MTHYQIFIFGLALTVFILLAAFFSLAETGLMAVSRYRLRHQVRLKKQYAVIALHLLKRPDRLLGAILIGNTFANMLTSALATLIAGHLWGDKGAICAVVVVALIVLIFAEVTPKTLAALYPEAVTRYVALPTRFLLWLLYPLVWLTNLMVNSFLKLFHIDVLIRHVPDALSREELRSIVYDTTHKLPRRYQNMLLGILDLNKLTVDDVMILQRDIVGIDLDESWEVILKQLHRLHQDWIPCYRDKMNQLVGVLAVQDVWHLALLSQAALNKAALQRALHTPYFTPIGTSLATQLAHFQRGVDKMAFVVDEYGDILGALTLNDILEEIVGDLTVNIHDSKRISEQKDHSYLVEGVVTIREINRTLLMTLPTEGAKTLSGLITEHLEALPHTGMSVLIARYPIEIVEVEENRVKVARIFQRV